MANENILATKTKQELLEKRKNKATTPDKVFTLDTLSSNAEILDKYGGQTALVFRIVIGSYWMLSPEQRESSFKLHPSFQKAINLPDRQRQRALKNLEDGGYIERENQPGHKTRIRLTNKGLKALAKIPAN